MIAGGFHRDVLQAHKLHRSAFGLEHLRESLRLHAVTITDPLRGRNNYFCADAIFFSAIASADFTNARYVLTLGVCPRSRMRHRVVCETPAASAHTAKLTLAFSLLR